MNLHHRPLFLFTIAYVAGILCAVEGNLNPAAGFGIAAAILVVGLIVPAKLLPRAVLALMGAVFAVGFVRSSIHRVVPTDDISRYAEGKIVYLTGVIASDPEPGGERVRFVLRAERVKTYTGEYAVSGRAMSTAYRPSWEEQANEDTRSAGGFVPFYGDRVRMHGRLRKPWPPSNPGGSSYAEYLSRRKVFCVISASTGEVEVLGHGKNSVKRIASRFKAGLSDRIYELFPHVHGSLLLGILLGNYAALPSDVQSAFKRTGTIHLLAASGYNCGVIVLIFGLIMHRLTVPRAATHGLLILLLWGFAIVAGAGPSVVRATIMMTTFLAAYLLWRAPDTINTILVAVLIITAANPLSLYDVGFQLSFAAVIAIVLVMPLIDPKVGPLFRPARGSWPGLPVKAALWSARTIVTALLLSIAAVLGTAPIAAWYFNYISIVSIVANALVAILVILLTAAGLASVALSCVVAQAGALAALAGTGVAGCMLGIVTELGKYPWSSFSVRSPSGAFLILYYLIFLGALEYAHRRAAAARQE